MGTASPPAKTLRISNGGGGTISWTAQAETSSGGNWLEISPASGSVSPGSPVAAQVRVLPGSLAPSVYTGSVRLTSQSTGQSETVPITLLIEPPTRTILLSQSGLSFTGVEGGAAVPSLSFGIANIGEGEMTWMVEATTLSGGPNWLTVSPREGRSQAGSLRVPQVEVGVNAAGLPAGQYNGLLRVNASGASNAPQFVAVTLDILPRGSNPGVTVRPTGMIFAAQAGTSSPGSQTVRLSTVAAGPIEVRSGRFTEDGRNWIEILPTSAIVAADDPRTIVVQPRVQGLAAGVYRGQLTLAFSDGSPTQRVEILFLVVAEPVGTLGTRESGLGIR
ncbi:MAG: BACON domain-containing protein, partial [Bryobacteraceae bacterium]